MIELIIGVDPGESNGVAIYSADKGLRLYTFKFWELIKFIDSQVIPAWKQHMKYAPKFIIENPVLNNFSYARNTRGKSVQEQLKIARNVGMNQGDAKRIIEYVTAHGMAMEDVKPTPNAAKWTSDYFNRLTRQQMRCNQHERDAARIISRYWIGKI